MIKLFFLVFSLFFLLGKSTRLIFFLLSLEVLMLSLLVYFLMMFYFFSFFFLGVFGVISSVGCLVLFLKLVVLVGKDQVFF